MLIKDIIDFILPAHCQICGGRLYGSEKTICTICIGNIVPTNYHTVPHNLMERLFWNQIPIDKATAYTRYDNDSSRQIVMLTKYMSHPEVGYRIAEIYARTLMQSDFFDGIDVIIPVPISWQRRLHRHYNQSEYIARAVSDVTGIPMRTDIVKKAIHNKTQTKLSHDERRDNTHGVYKLLKPEHISGKHILLIDDVVTTGSTIISCAKELMKADNVIFTILSLAHATRHIHTQTKNDEADSSAFGLPFLK